MSKAKKKHVPKMNPILDHFGAEAPFWLVKMDKILIARVDAYRKAKGYNKKETLRRMANALLNATDPDKV